MTNHTCDKCGRELDANTVFCPHCGAAVFHSKAAPTVAKPSKVLRFLPAAAVVVAVIAVGCLIWSAFDGAPDPQPSSPSTEQTTPQTTAPTKTDPPETTEPLKAPPLSLPLMPEATPGIRLDDSILAQFQRLLIAENSSKFRNFYNLATLCSFDSPENVNLYQLFGRGIYMGETELTDEERTHFADQIERSYTTASYRFLPEDMDTVLTKYFGITLAESNKVGLDQFEYWEETGCYYLFHPTPEYNDDIEVINGKLLSANTIQLTYYSSGAYQDADLPQSEQGYCWDITLQATESGNRGYHILSNTLSSQKNPEAITLFLPPAEPGTALTKELLDQFQRFLTSDGDSEQNFYNQALMTIFSDPSEIDLRDLIYNGIGQERTLTEEERDYILSSTGRPLSRAYCFTPEDMDAVLTKHFGISLASHKTGLEGTFLYWEKTGCYYWSPLDFHEISDLRVIVGEYLSADTVRIDYVSDLNNSPQSVTFQITDDRCIILSNVPTATTTDPQPPQVMNEMDEVCARTAMTAYFAQRQQYIQGEADSIPMAYEPLFRDEAKHLKAIQDHGYKLLFSHISVDHVNCWDSMAEVFATETCSYLIGGEEKIFTIAHTILVGIGGDNLPQVTSDGYLDTAVDFTSCSYIPPELTAN